MDEHPAPDHLSAYLDGELTDAAAERITVHVLVCHDCADALHDARVARLRLRSLPAVEPPAGFFESLLVVRSHRSAWAASAVAAAAIGLTLSLAATGQPARAVQMVTPEGVVLTVAGDGSGAVVPDATPRRESVGSRLRRAADELLGALSPVG